MPQNDPRDSRSAAPATGCQHGSTRTVRLPRPGTTIASSGGHCSHCNVNRSSFSFSIQRSLPQVDVQDPLQLPRAVGPLSRILPSGIAAWVVSQVLRIPVKHRYPMRLQEFMHKLSGYTPTHSSHDSTTLAKARCNPSPEVVQLLSGELGNVTDDDNGR